MAKREVELDFYVHELLQRAGIATDAQGSNVPEIERALASASKRKTGLAGRPEFVAVVRDFVLVMEDKADRAFLQKYDEEGVLNESAEATQQYAVNGALHYARHILQKTAFKKVFAFGNAGDRTHHILQPLFVDTQGYKVLPEVATFENFTAEHINEYYRRAVLGEVPEEEQELKNLLDKAKQLHEDLRNYGGLGEDEKPLVVSAILLALREKAHGFNLEQLTGDQVNTDGNILYQHLEHNLQRANVAPQVKKDQVLAQFALIKIRPQLNKVHDQLKKTPLKFFTEYIDKHIFRALVSNAREDMLGRFYGEFVSYSGGDGQALGVVLTPRHITELFCELVNLRPSDVLFDPCCGTGGFLVSGMHKMLQAATNDAERKHIKQRQIHGVELRDDMFSIATTNMILRGDGQSNLLCGDFLGMDPSKLQLNGGGLTVGFMNPPYSQAKTKETAHLSELCFIRHLLNSLIPGGRAAVIVPLSTMIGKTRDDKAIKSELLKHHTLEGVISLNKDTFYGVGTVPCIAVFTAGEPHPAEKYVKFINFEDDGYEVKKHIGLSATERAKDRKEYLLGCWHGDITDAPSDFMVQAPITATDEWLHAFYYYNDEIPTEADFLNSIADYLTFEFNMITHGRAYLFDSPQETPPC